MLILTRKKGERIIIGDNVEVTVLSVSGNQVRVGVEAPREISIHREEIYYKLHGAKVMLSEQEHRQLGLPGGAAVNE